MLSAPFNDLITPEHPLCASEKRNIHIHYAGCHQHTPTPVHLTLTSTLSLCISVSRLCPSTPPSCSITLHQPSRPSTPRHPLVAHTQQSLVFLTLCRLGRLWKQVRSTLYLLFCHSSGLIQSLIRKRRKIRPLLEALPQASLCSSPHIVVSQKTNLFFPLLTMCCFKRDSFLK